MTSLGRHVVQIKCTSAKKNVRVNQSQCLVITYPNRGAITLTPNHYGHSKKTRIFKNMSMKKEFFGSGIMMIKKPDVVFGLGTNST